MIFRQSKRARQNQGRRTKETRRRRLARLTSRKAEVEKLEDRRLLVIGAFVPAAPTGTGTGFDGVVGLAMQGAEEALFPTTKGEIGHRGGHANVDANIAAIEKAVTITMQLDGRCSRPLDLDHAVIN